VADFKPIGGPSSGRSQTACDYTKRPEVTAAPPDDADCPSRVARGALAAEIQRLKRQLRDLDDA
jgi:hypothetical protein